MKPFRSILVDVDSSAAAQPALERAARLAQGSGARMTLVDVLTVPPHARRLLPARVEGEMLGARRVQLERLGRTVSGVEVESRVLTGRPGTALIHEVLRSEHDLLVRSHARDMTGSPRRPFGAVDMELLRKCPCPVLLVRHGSLAPHPRIAAAVNASAEELEVALNESIAETACLMARLEGGTVTLLHAWLPFAEETIRQYSSEDAFAAYVGEVRQRGADDLAALAASLQERCPALQTALRRGAPEVAIPEYVVGEGVDLVVMGTVGRAGISGMLIGNTAERLLGRLPCSVLAVKPAGFVTPVRLE